MLRIPSRTAQTHNNAPEISDNMFSSTFAQKAVEIVAGFVIIIASPNLGRSMFL
jgi:hypothetical protein